jgi:peptidoglycan DL-endopeptidase CwlO
VVRLPPSPSSLRSSRRFGQWSRRVFVSLLTVVILIVGVLIVVEVVAPLAGTAQTSKSKQREVERLQDELDELDDEMSLLNEEANEAQERLQKAKEELASADEGARESQQLFESTMQSAKTQAQRRFTGSTGPGLDTDRSLQDNARRRVYLEVGAGRRADQIDALNEATQDFARSRSRAERAAGRAKSEQQAVNRALQRTEQLADRQEALLNKAERDVVRLLAAEEQRRIVAEARAARAAEQQRQRDAAAALERRKAERRRAEEAAAAAARERGRPRLERETSPTTRPRGTNPVRELPPAAPGEDDDALAAEAGVKSNAPPAVGGNRAVEVAMAQLGKAYVWGANGPVAFDCSGLTSYAWLAAGKRLPRTSRAQFAATQRIAKSELQPGDLLFFAKPGRPIHHVAMYIGNGQMVEAPHRRARVRVRSILRRDYVGAGRIR